MKVVIMAGGKGIRFWPRSVISKPKQFLALTSHQTMLQLTYARFLQWLPETSIYIITTQQYSPLVEEQLPNLNKRQLILEPDQRDTGPCTALTALHFLRRNDDEVLVTTPSDQYIPDAEALKAALLKAEKAAAAGKSIVTLGIVPSRAETGYGYMKASAADPKDEVLTVKAFMEKPSAEKAELLVQDSGVFWNSGIFVWKPSTIAHYMSLHQPEMWKALNREEMPLSSAYSMLPKISVDYAVMEKADCIFTIPVDFEWDDVGSWASLARMNEPDTDGNIIKGAVLSDGCRNSIIISDDAKKTVAIGVEDLIVVSTSEGLLVCRRSEEHRIKHVLKSLVREEGGQPLT